MYALLALLREGHITSQQVSKQPYNYLNLLKPFHIRDCFYSIDFKFNTYTHVYIFIYIHYGSSLRTTGLRKKHGLRSAPLRFA